MMDEIRTRLATFVARDHADGWLMRAYVFLVEIGATEEQSLEALSDFVDQVIARKHAIRKSDTGV
jgi:hypothetical protein